MGYYVEMAASTVTIPEANEAEALKRFKELNKQDHLKNGGSSNGEKWFSWMNNVDFDKIEKIEDVIGQAGLGFDTDRIDGAVVLYGYDSKIGQESLFFETIADLITPGYVEWHGEDGEMWRWVFDGTLMTKISPTISWEA